MKRRLDFVLKGEPFKDYYKVLGARPTATRNEIQANYYELAKLHHPDIGGDPDRMAAVNEAWEVLDNPVKRREYDQKRSLLLGRRKCSRCKGSGTVYKQVSFTRRTAVNCTACGGTGVAA